MTNSQPPLTGFDAHNVAILQAPMPQDIANTMRQHGYNESDYLTVDWAKGGSVQQAWMNWPRKGERVKAVALRNCQMLIPSAIAVLQRAILCHTDVLFVLCHDSEPATPQWLRS